MSQLRLFADTVSPPSRAVMLLLAHNNISHEYVRISLKEGKILPSHTPYFYFDLIGEQHTNPELLAINPNKRIPAIEDGGFTLFERSVNIYMLCNINGSPPNSVAILKYIHNKYSLPDHWYPRDLKKQARVDEALSWFPQNIRCGAYYLTVS